MLTIDRPPHNFVSVELMAAWPTLEGRRQHEIRVSVLAAAGKNFSAYWLPPPRSAPSTSASSSPSSPSPPLAPPIHTVLGFELLVTGLNPTAAKLAGMPVNLANSGHAPLRRFPWSQIPSSAPPSSPNTPSSISSSLSPSPSTSSTAPASASS